MCLVKLYIYGIVLSIMKAGLCLKCYQCDTRNNPACGVAFKAYQFEAITCGLNEKCGLQRQEPSSENDGFVGILRSCYRLGDLAGINETDGCREWTIRQPNDNFTASYCFCSGNYCNHGTILTPPGVTQCIFIFAALSLILSKWLCK